jgi:FHS family L-fucose permease-like MFS transporter
MLSSQVQSQLVAWAFYVAYFVGSIFFLVIKVDVLQKFDTKDIICWFITLHLVLLCLFLQHNGIPFFLTALFTVGLGFSIQQIVANPLAIKMGSPILEHTALTLVGESTLLNYYWCNFTRNLHYSEWEMIKNRPFFRRYKLPL